MKKLLLALLALIHASYTLFAEQVVVETDNNLPVQEEQLVTTIDNPVVSVDPVWQVNGGWGTYGYTHDWYGGRRVARHSHHAGRAGVRRQAHRVDKHKHAHKKASRRRRTAHAAKHRAHRKMHHGHAGHRHGHGGRRR